MSTQQEAQPQQPPPTPGQAFHEYTESLDADGTPLLGHLVLYSVYEGEVRPVDLERWFTELGLDPRHLPKPLRRVDAFEKVTGRDGVHLTYRIDEPSADSSTAGDPAPTANHRPERTAVLMPRHVKRDGGEIVRHIVREVRDAKNNRLDYDPRIAVCTFKRDHSQGSDEGAGELHIELNLPAIVSLPQNEQDHVRKMLADIEEQYRRRCHYLSADRLRKVIRDYIDDLHAVCVRSKGGVYFVHRQYSGVVDALRTLVSRFGGRSRMWPIPLPDHHEMREEVVAEITTKQRDDLNKLALDIAQAQRSGADQSTIEHLHQRFQDLNAEAAQQAQLLNTSLDDTDAALQLVKTQLVHLLTSPADDD